VIQDESEESFAMPDQQVMAGWNNHIKSLATMFRFSEEKDPYELRVEGAVHRRSREYYNSWAAKARGILADVDSFAIRWCERAWEIAINLHMGIHGVDCASYIDLETFENAIKIADYFADRQLEVLARPRIEAQQKQRCRLLEVFEEHNNEAMTMRT